MDNKSQNLVIIAFFVGVAIYLMSTTDTTIPAGSGSTLEVQIVDSPTTSRVSSLVVQISKVQVHYDEPGVNATGWISVKETPSQVDLVKLKNIGVPEVIGYTDIQPGKYTQIRMNIDSAQVTLIDNSIYSVTIPSGELKVIQGFTLERNTKLILTLDLDIDKSLQQDGVGKYTLKPTVKLLASNVDCTTDTDCSGYDATATCGPMTKCVSGQCHITSLGECPINLYCEPPSVQIHCMIDPNGRYAGMVGPISEGQEALPDGSCASGFAPIDDDFCKYPCCASCGTEWCPSMKQCMRLWEGGCPDYPTTTTTNILPASVGLN